MPGYVDFDLGPLDQGDLIQRAFDAIVAAFPGWNPNEAHLEVALIEEMSRLNAETRVVAADVAKAIFRTFGEKLVGILPVAGTPASATSTWVAIDNVGYTIPAGTLVGYRLAGDEVWAFETTVEATIAPGALNVAGVVVQATEIGDARNGVTAGTLLEMIDNLAWVQSVTLTSDTAGGADAETDDSYLDRLNEELQLLAPRPILARDYAVMARRTAGVHRALAIDGYNPVANTDNNERTVAVAALDPDGVPIVVGVKNLLDAALQAAREVNFDIKVFDATTTVVDVTFTATARTGYVSAAVEAAAEQAVRDYLNPATWSGGDESPPEWWLNTKVRLYEIGTVLNEVEGLDYITVLTLGKNGGAQAAADVNLDGRAPIVSPGAINGTVP